MTMTNKPVTLDDMIKHIVEHTDDLGYLSIEFNGPKHNYETVSKNLSYGPDYEEGEGFDGIEDYRECIKTDVMWEITWYPHHPVSCYVTYGSTLEKALGLMFKICKEVREKDNDR
jgi:hypothetical protein